MEREAPKEVHGKERPLSELKMIDSGMGILLKEMCKMLVHKRTPISPDYQETLHFLANSCIWCY